MLTLAEVLQSEVSQVIQKNGQVANTDVLVGAAQRSKIEGALRLLTPPGYFAAWFGGWVVDGATSKVHQGTDPSHPLLHLPIRSRIRSLRKAPAYVLSLNAALNDLLRHRAWLEIAGETSDLALLRGEALPSDRSRPRLNVSLARQLRNKGMSFRQIADELGVSGAAVHKALNKTTSTTTTSKASI
jgi:predicted XRE-type DNA-binding protein